MQTKRGSASQPSVKFCWDVPDHPDSTPLEFLRARNLICVELLKEQKFKIVEGILQFH